MRRKKRNGKRIGEGKRKEGREMGEEKIRGQKKGWSTKLNMYLKSSHFLSEKKCQYSMGNSKYCRSGDIEGALHRILYTLSS